jgi:hypothetical protein
MLMRFRVATALAVLLGACSARGGTLQNVTRIGAGPTAFCPAVPTTPARQTAKIYTAFAPDPVHNVFALHFSRQWAGPIGSPEQLQLPQDAIRVELQSASRKTVTPSPIRALGSSGLPAQLRTSCWHDDGGVNYRYAVDERRLQAALYHLTVNSPANPEVQGRGDWIYVAPQPRATPALQIGRRYLVVPIANVVYADDHARTIPWSAISLRVARVTTIDSETVMLRVENTPYTLRETRSGDASTLLGLVPLLEDATQTAMQAWYGGKRIWVRGQLQSLCASDPAASNINWDGSLTIRVRNVYRVALPFFELALGQNVGGSGYGRASGFQVSSPLLITLDISNTGAGARCNDAYAFFADGWDMQRALSTSSVRATHPSWPTEILKSIDDGAVRVGMTHEMVAWSIGFPAFPGAVSDLYHLSRWDYDDDPGQTYYVDFGENGKVKGFGTFPGSVEYL